MPLNPIDWHRRFLQQASWTQPLRNYLYRLTGMKMARHVLEVGCGSGALLLELPSLTTAAVHGLDIDEQRLEQAARHAPAVHLVQGDAHRLPYFSQAFDISLCHYLLLWLSDPVQALREMKRVTRPGGYVLALAEPDHTGRVDRPEPLAELGLRQAESLRRQGADPSLGKRLPELFDQAGISLLENGRLRNQYTHRLTPEEIELEWAVLEADLAGMMPEKDLLRLKKLDEEAWQCGQRVLFVPTYYACGQVATLQ